MTDRPHRRPTWRVRHLAAALACLLAVSTVGAGCNSIPQSDLKELETPKVEVFFNSTGTREGNQRDLKPSEFLVERIDAAEATIDIAAYGFSKRNLVEAVIRAYDRGVKVRFVGSTSHMHEYGYQRLMERHIPMQIGNEFHIMHEKFIVIDGRFVFAGTGNFTGTGFRRNNNNWIWMESEPLAEDFRAQFEEMYAGRFSNAKRQTNDRTRFKIGDTTVDVYFQPGGGAVDRLVQEIRNADSSIYFQIFAFTHDQVGSALIRKHRQFVRQNDRASHSWRSKPPRQWPKKVVGLLDRSQIHGNGQFHEGYRLTAFGVPMRMEANDATLLPGDYQKGGGRLHTKTMILDPGTEDARVVTGSFNWSSSASLANDEVMMVLRGERIAQRFMSMYDELWLKSRPLTEGFCYYQHPGDDGSKPTCADEVEQGDIIFSEVHWDGWNGRRNPTEYTGKVSERPSVSNDEFIELYNTTNEPINLSMWSITNGEDYIVGFPPGTVIGPGEHYLLADHNLVPFAKRAPQRGASAFVNPEFVLNTPNDPRYHNLNLKNGQFYIDLRKPEFRPRADEQPVDAAGDGGPPFRGGRTVKATYPQAGQTRCERAEPCKWDADEKICKCSDTSDALPGEPELTVVRNQSMERKGVQSGDVPDGTKASSWRACSYDGDGDGELEGGKNVHPKFREKIIATPGQANSSP
ncbi:MAG: phospholipase D-like domain-containing protein [Bradymonadaceae bacterium]